MALRQAFREGGRRSGHYSDQVSAQVEQKLFCAVDGVVAASLTGTAPGIGFDAVGVGTTANAEARIV